MPLWLITNTENKDSKTTSVSTLRLKQNEEHADGIFNSIFVDEKKNIFKFLSNLFLKVQLIISQCQRW